MSNNVPSSIPVRHDRNAAPQTRQALAHHAKDQANIKSTFIPHSKKSQPDESKKNHAGQSRIPPRRLSERELKEENSSLKQDIKNQTQSIKRLETCIKESEEKTSTMEQELEALKVTHVAAKEEIQRKASFLESKVESYEKKLLLSNIDPVTMEVLESGEEVKKKLDEVKQQKKTLNEQLKKMNKECITYIQEMKIMTDSLEVMKENLPVYTEGQETGHLC